MKKILIILDGAISKKLLRRIINANTSDNIYDVIYMNENILPVQKPSNFTFYKFDPTSKSKLFVVLDKSIHTEVLMALASKDETLSVIRNIRDYKKNLQITFLDYWDIKIENDPMTNVYNGIDVLSNGMLERLPNIPIIAQNIGLKEGEIMEIRIPVGSSYAYRSIGSIEQSDWKIFALYRDQVMVGIKPSLVLKPNDLILVIGKPNILMNIYNAIGKTQGQFPMPFGTKIYLYLDLYLENERTIRNALNEAKFVNQKLKNILLVIRITRPTTANIMNIIKFEISSAKDINLQIDYSNEGLIGNFSKDIKQYNIGMIILTSTMFKYKNDLKDILFDFKIPVLKLGKQSIKSAKRTCIVLNDTKAYEQISPIVFDISSQLNVKTKLLNLDPIGDKDGKTELVNHFENLAKIYNEKLEITSSSNNPIRELMKERDIIQILPLRKKMFKKRFFLKIFNTNSDVIAFDIKKFTQLLIPVLEE